MGAPALTTRGFLESDFVQVADFVHRAVEITKKLKEQTGPKLKDFKALLADGQPIPDDIAALRADVETFAMEFPTIGFERSELA